MSGDENALPQWAVRRPRTNVIDSPMADLLGIERVTSTEDNPETSGAKDDTGNDEHIACLEQQITDLQGGVERVRNFGKLPVSNTPPQEPRTTAPMLPHFPSLESPVRNHFPPQHTQPISTPVMNSHLINPPHTNQAHVNPSMTIHLSCSKTHLAKFLPILNMLPRHPFKSLSTHNLSPQFPTIKSPQIKFPSIHNIPPNFPYIKVLKTKFLQTHHMPHQLPLLTILHQFKIT
ncbi:hypothetical protein KY284_001310 [Solanum tuberosum]|nr:hypothetical protein KY284_001310 [Solanum tuberosum]